MPNQPIDSANPERAAELFQAAESSLHRTTDRVFAGLMMFQWLAAIIAALLISPKTWIGASSQIHAHVWAAIILGGIIACLPAWLAWKHPGQASTRQTIAVAQMFFSALLIDVTGGRIETHFHVFGSLAFLAFYRDPKLLYSATVVVALDHILRGFFWPQSVFGVAVVSNWRWLEHAGWVLFEDTFLLFSIRQSLKEMHTVAERQASLEKINATIEQKVIDRTAELTKVHKQLVEASRQAGMAEVATSVLHNVGNVLNSVNVSGSLISERMKGSKVVNVTKIADLLRKQGNDLGNYMVNDPNGRRLPEYMMKLGSSLEEERTGILREIESLSGNIGHIKEIVAMQQDYAKSAGVLEVLKVADLVEDAIRMNDGAMSRHKVKIVREFAETPAITTDRHKILQILVNVLRNAKYACDDSHRDDKQITVRIAHDGERIKIAIADNGIGIPPENLTRIFGHGFTTKKDGHGFGLHSGALAAKELGGVLDVSSEGTGKGATFTLELPVK